MSQSPPFKNTIICQDCTINNGVTIGHGTVLHPKASITTEHGAPIEIGESNIIEEFVQIINRSKEKMIIGSNNLFEVGSLIECKLIGNENVIETKSKVYRDVVIGNSCVISAGSIVPENEILDDNTVYSVTDRNRLKFTSPIPSESHMSIHPGHLEHLHKTLPNFHNMKKNF
ncbi:dynactin subunit p27 [Tieghemostelium lacteum]|uniref:Dynactin subunit 6 n=1 Tax=Tieghemostelium lacteum TaxID=361077 RepID=A0A151Z306_TIELA|nr:dynactin subunit p27 [Tieghemostelium lacteum]|eukprot:KYQ88335.1 dynactin subunit p27 [Tieghemostelium lacteum]